MKLAPVYTLNDGTTLPALGLGTYPLDDADAARAVVGAVGAAYRLVDTAANYGNEEGVGRGIAESGVERGDIRLTTKLPGRSHGYDETLASFEESRRRLGLEYVDLYLIHWPLPRIDRYADSWRAMIRLREEGRVRSIGVSNFTPDHLDRLRRETGVLPSVNQVELHPRFTQAELRSVHEELGVRTESWSPLGRGSALLRDPEIGRIARTHGVTPAQVVLRWHVQLGAVPIPKSADPERQRANLDVFGFVLSEEEMAAVADGPQERLGGDPESHEEF